MTENEVVLIIQKIARDIRGQIINIFTNTEVLMDDIIRKTTFDSEATYDTYMDILQRGELTMTSKKKLLKLCIDKFEKKHGTDLTVLKTQIDNVIDKRNKLAHWVADTSIDGITLYKEKRKIRLISMDKNRQKVEVYFDQHTAADTEKNIYAVTSSLVKMQKAIYLDLGL